MKQSRKRCCLILLVIVILLAIGGVLVYFFAPWQDVVDKVELPSWLGGGGDDGGMDDNTTMAPTAAPTNTPLFDYQFIQCTDMNGTCCNGLEEICDLGVDDILWATSHNAMATKEGGFLFGYNHLYNLEESLRAGYRAISIDVCNCGGIYQLCHGICGIGIRDPVEVFQNMMQFLNEHPSEIIMINLQINNEAQGGYPVNLNTFSNLLFNEVEGLDAMLYNHDNVTQPWPTLQNLKDLGERMLLFHFNGPSCPNPGDCPNGFHYWFDFGAETEFDFKNIDEFDNVDRSCRITRGAGGTKDFFAVTSFVTPPNEDAAVTINTASFLRDRMETCSRHNGLLDVNLLYVDFWSIGDMPEMVQNHNRALAARRRSKRRKMLRA